MNKLDKLGRVIKTDVLVVGGGICGVLAAIKAKEQAEKVLIVEKSYTGYAGQVPHSGGAIMVLSPEDNLDAWMRWKVEEGAYLNNQEWLYTLGKNIYGCLQEMGAWGAPFTRDEKGAPTPVYRPQHHYYQNYQFDQDKLMLFLRNKARSQGVDLLDRVEVVDLIHQNGKVNGALGFHVLTGEFCIFEAKAVIIATSSCNYRVRIAMRMSSGEGVRMAYRAGAELLNAEFANLYGWGHKGTLAGSRTGVSTYFVNRNGENILDKHFPEVKGQEDHTKTAMAMTREVEAGLGPIYFDLTHANEEEIERLKGKTHRLRLANYWRMISKVGIDPQRERTEWIPLLSGKQGPIRIDLECRSTVPGLWAGGDAAYQGAAFDGALSPCNHPGHGIAFAVVSGFLAGESAGRYAAASPQGKVDPAQVAQRKRQIYQFMANKEGIDPNQLIYEIQETVVPVKYNLFRSQSRLLEALAKIDQIKERLNQMKVDNVHELVKCEEAKGMALCAELTYRAALMRQESRGSHMLEDFPLRDDVNWLKWICIKDEVGVMKLTTEPVPVTRYPLKLQP